MSKYNRTKEEIDSDFELEMDEFKDNFNIAKSLSPLV